MRRITFHPSDVQSPALGRLKRSQFLDEQTDKVYLFQYDAMSSTNPDLALCIVEDQRL